MLMIRDAFIKFRGKLELTPKEQNDASRRQREIREVMDLSFAIQHDFLTGSYARWTKTKPLSDVDIFCVFHDDERSKYRDNQRPSRLLNDVESVLIKKYGQGSVSKQRRSVNVEFADSMDEDRVMSFDVVPVFTIGDPDKDGHYELPDEKTSKGWTETDPRVHYDKAVSAQRAFSNEWKGMVRMAKAWNRQAAKPVKPSFLLEVMAFDLLRPPFGGDFPREFMAFFHSAADRIHETWPDPAGLGPAVSDAMDNTARDTARKALIDASYTVREGIQLSASGRNGEALQAYRRLFGPYFPLS